MLSPASPDKQGPPDVVRGGSAHSAVIAALHAQCFDEAWDAASIAHMLSTPGTFALIAQGEKQPLGFILFRVAGGEGEMLALGVAPLARGHGVAGCVLDAAIQEAASRGAKALFLEVAADNAAARGLYRSRGFCRVGRRPHYYGSRGDGASADALILRRDLSDERPES